MLRNGGKFLDGQLVMEKGVQKRLIENGQPDHVGKELMDKSMIKGNFSPPEMLSYGICCLFCTSITKVIVSLSPKFTYR